MTEAEISQALQKDLAYLKVSVAARQKDNHLHVLITRQEGQTIEYGSAARLVRTSLRTLRDRNPSLGGVDMVTLYGRLNGEKEFEWKVTSDLNRSEGEDREGATIFIPDDLEEEENEDPTVIAAVESLSSLRSQATDQTLVYIPNPKPQPPTPTAKTDSAPIRSGPPPKLFIGIGIAVAVILLVIAVLVLR